MNYQICDAFPIGISILQGGQYSNFQGYYVPLQLPPQQQRLSSNPQHINSLSKFEKQQQKQPKKTNLTNDNVSKLTYQINCNLSNNCRFTGANVSGAGSTPVQTHQQNAHHINHSLHMPNSVTSYSIQMQRSQPVNIRSLWFIHVDAITKI